LNKASNECSLSAKLEKITTDCFS